MSLLPGVNGLGGFLPGVGGNAGGGGGSAPFDPMDDMVAGAVWYDASDASTITKDGSDRISELRDKSGNGNHLTQATDAKKPLANVTLNGVDCIDCRPDKFMLPAQPIFDVAGPCEVFAVLYSDRAGSADNTLIAARPSSSTLNRNIWAAKTQFGGTTLQGSLVTRGNGTMRHTLIQHSYTNGTTGTFTQYQWIDGRLLSGSVTCTGVAGNSGMFGTSTGTTSMNGLFAEFVKIPHELTPERREAWRNYLTNKWRYFRDDLAHYHVVPIGGQSNGRGAYGPVNLTDDATDPRILQLARTYVEAGGAVIEDFAGELRLAEHPLENRWRDTASPPAEDSVGPAMAYAKALLATLPADEGVLLIPCAQGSTYVMDSPPLSPDVTWSPTPGGSFSNAPYLDLVGRTNRILSELGSRASLHSIYWHHGENEATRPTMAESTYAGFQDAVLTGFRTDITGASSVPIVLGELGTFLDGGSFPNRTNVNNAILDTPNRLANVAVASSAGLTDGGDGVHFDAASARTLGGRYFTAYGTI